MKIDTDLRAAIRSAYLQRKRTADDWAVRRAAEKAAIAALLKSKPALARRVAKARADANRANIAAAKASQIISAIGISHDGERIHDTELFVKAGGAFKFSEAPRWTFDQVMAQLASATPREGAAILTKLGINWQ
jgi:hypothetical protein